MSGSGARAASDDSAPSWWARFRRSNTLVVVVNFFSMFTGIMVVSVLQPILPNLLDVLYQANNGIHHNGSLVDDASTPPLGADGPVPANETYANKPFIIGSLLGFAPLIEILFTPLAVIAIKYCGFKKTMIFACMLQLFGCYAIAYASVLMLLYAARVGQAISVIFATVAGFSLVAVRFPDDDARSHAIATSMHGFPIGILVAYPCGTFIYSYFGVAIPFVIISVLTVVGTVLVLCIQESEDDQDCQDDEGSSYFKILADPAIILSLGLISYSWFVVFLLGATTPNRMATLMRAASWEIGLVMFVSTLGQVVTSAVVGKLAARLNRWRVTLVGNLTCCIGLVAYPFCQNIYHTIGPETAVRIGWGFVTSSMGPLLGTLVDQSHGNAYVRVYALFMSFNLFGAFAGSLVGGWFDGIVGFNNLYWGASVLTFVVAIGGYALTCCLPERMSKDTVLTDSIYAPEYETLHDSVHRHSFLSGSYSIAVA